MFSNRRIDSLKQRRSLCHRAGTPGSTYQSGAAGGENPAPRLAVASPVASPIAAQEMWAIVEIEDFQCVPGTIEIDVGTTIRWKNLDLSAHTATSIESLFNSDRLDRSAGFRFTFETPGSSSYVCQYHKDMAGIVIVN